jgi:hypothetical protein
MNTVLRQSRLSWHAELDLFFRGEGPVWHTLHTVEKQCAQANIGFVIIGALALNAHGYRRQTTNVDVVMTSAGWELFQSTFGGHYAPIEGWRRRVQDRTTDVQVKVYMAGALAGRRDRNRLIVFPNPCDAQVHRGIQTVSLIRLIELKLATWRYKDMGDVVELIRLHQLSNALVQDVSPIVRPLFCECLREASDPRFDEPLG